MIADVAPAAASVALLVGVTLGLRRRERRRTSVYGRTDPYGYRYELGLPPLAWPEPWRRNPRAAGCVVVPVAVLIDIADPDELGEARRLRRDRIDWVRDSINANGVELPVIVVVDAKGHVTVRDGHHRILAADELGMPGLPCEVQTSPGIPRRSRPIVEVIGPLLRGVAGTG